MKNKKIKTAIILVIFAGIICLSGKVMWDIIISLDYSEPIGLEKSALIEIFNDHFTKFEGESQLSSAVKVLIINIEEMNGGKRNVKYIGPKFEELINTKTYKVELKYNNEGYVSEVIVTENEY